MGLPEHASDRLKSFVCVQGEHSKFGVVAKSFPSIFSNLALLDSAKERKMLFGGGLRWRVVKPSWGLPLPSSVWLCELWFEQRCKKISKSTKNHFSFVLRTRTASSTSAIPSVVRKTPSRMALIISCSFLVRYSCTSPRSSASLAERTSHSTVVAEEYLRFCSNRARHEMTFSAKPKLSGSNAWRSRRCIAALKVLKNCVATPTCP